MDRVARAIAAADLLVFGGGGLLQDETSALNLPLHLSRPVLARLLRTPVVGVGLGARGLTTALGRREVGLALRGYPVSVRDAGSVAVLRPLLDRAPVLAADLAVSLPRPQAHLQDRMVVCLRPWAPRASRRLVPVALRRTHPLEDWAVAGLAGALDASAERTGLAVHFVAFEADRDHVVHEAVAARMRSSVTFARPDLTTVLAEVASGRVVVSMRYHGGIAALLGGRPSVLVGYSPKVEGLAGDLGRAARFVELSPTSLPSIPSGVSEVLESGDHVEEAYAALAARETGTDRVLDEVLDPIRAVKARTTGP